MKTGIDDIVGKTISSVITTKNKMDPRNQVFLVFSDRTYFEFYGAHFTCASGVVHGSYTEAMAYAVIFKGDITTYPTVNPNNSTLSQYKYSDNNNSKRLPSWFQRPKPIKIMIPTPLPGYIVTYTEDNIYQLIPGAEDRDQGLLESLLSFEVEELPDELDIMDPRLNELNFVEDLSMSCLSDDQIEKILAGCPRPYSFDPDSVAFSFRHGWVQVVAASDSDDVIKNGLQQWLQECDLPKLINIRDQVIELIKQSQEIPPEFE